MRDRAKDRFGGSPWPRRRVLRLLAVAEAFQSVTRHHLRRPDLDAVLAYREGSS